MARKLNGYDRQSTPDTAGFVKGNSNILARVLYNFDANEIGIWYGFSDPGSIGPGRWNGAVLLPYGQASPIYEGEADIFFRPDAGTDPVTLTIHEEYGTGEGR